MLIETKLTLQIDKAIEEKNWKLIEDMLNDTNLQFYHPDKIAIVGLCLLEELKDKGYQ